MMNIKKTHISLSIALFAVAFQAAVAQAALVPSFFLATANNNTQTQVTVIGADPNASVTLYYPQNGAHTSLTIGTTDATGRLSTMINPSTYSITSGASGYVRVNGAQSQMQAWPTYTASSQNSSAGLSLSQSNLTVTVGQSTAVSVGVNAGIVGTLSVPSNTNPSVASALVSGSNIIVNGSVAGGTTMTVCASSAGCTTLYVTVQQPVSSNAPTISTNQAISFSPTSLSMKVGETRTVALSGSGSYYISAHSRPGTVSNSISGSTLTLTGTNAGNDDISLCSSGSTTVSCATLVVAVTAADPSGSNSVSGGTISFSPNNLTLGIAETKTLTVTGSGLGSYYISSNPNTDSVSANLVGNSITVTGNKMGGGNITVCQFGGQCGNFYAYVPANATNNAAAPTVSTKPLALASFGVSSNNVNNKFLGSGVAITVTFSANQSVSNPMVFIGGSGVPVYGGGSGPYTAIYTMSGNEAAPISVDIDLGNGSGTSRFTIGGSAAAAVTPPASISQTFTTYLEVGSTGSQVTALQNRLTALGVYSGPITGTFGAQTEAAVKKYQAKHGIDQLGAVGPATRSKLNQGI